MSVATFQPALSVGSVQMDNDRKRPALANDIDDPAGPPLKKQITMTNGAPMGEAVDVPKFGSINSTWQVDLETFQKDAILRQLKEYKRERQDLEKSVSALKEESKYHDDHLRFIDSWWHQLVDEVSMLVGSGQGTDIAFDTSSLLFADSELFEQHLASRSKNIKKAISALYSKSQPMQPDVQVLQKRVNELLAQEKQSLVELSRLRDQLKQIDNRLEDATLRYMVAERKLDRLKSQTVLNIEKQGALASQVVKPEIEEDANGDAVNGVKREVGAVTNDEAERERAEAVAVSRKAKEQLALLEQQNTKLTSALTTAKARLDSLTDEDFAGTELFKIMKTQLEDSLNKINDLEATHIQLREEAKKMHAERTAYRTKIDEEALTSTSSTEILLANRDADLQRIRAARDDLISKVSIAEQSNIDRQASVDQALAMVQASEERNNALENEVTRLRVRCGEAHGEMTSDSQLDADALRTQVANLREECRTLESELPSIEQAYKKAQAAATAKYAAHDKIDEQIALLKQGKIRADQKYFAIMKYKDQLDAELIALRKSDKTSSGIISSLKDADAKTKELAVNLERQNAEYLDTIEKMTQERQVLEQKAAQASMAANGCQSQLLKLKESLSEKDSTMSGLESTGRENQREVEALKVRLEDQTKKTEDWKKKANSSSSEELVRLRAVAFCHCQRSVKDTVISSCGHITCKQCVEERVTTRQRKCPICMKPFGQKDFFAVHLV